MCIGWYCGGLGTVPDTLRIQELLELKDFAFQTETEDTGQMLLQLSRKIVRILHEIY